MTTLPSNPSRKSPQEFLESDRRANELKSYTTRHPNRMTCTVEALSHGHALRSCKMRWGRQTLAGPERGTTAAKVQYFKTVSLTTTFFGCVVFPNTLPS